MKNHISKTCSYMITYGPYVHTLGYADDIALIDEGNAADIVRASERVSLIAFGSREDADMIISIPKTKVLHVAQQTALAKVTSTEAEQQCKFCCPFHGCDHKFCTEAGLRIHKGRCEWKDEFVVEKIVAHKKGLLKRQYLIKWKGYDEKTWERRSNIHPELVSDYEKESDIYDED